MTSKILTFRIPAPIYSELCAAAAELGLPVSAHVRRLIEQEHQAGQIAQLRSELLAKFGALAQPVSVASPRLDEILLLSRAIATHCNPQLVAQIRAKLAQPK